MTDAPERYFLNIKARSIRTNSELLMRKRVHSTDIEYIPKDIADKQKQEATKPIQEVWEKYMSLLENSPIKKIEIDVNDLWQAIKATGINAGWIKDEK